jgi:hypothetical protein
MAQMLLLGVLFLLENTYRLFNAFKSASEGSPRQANLNTVHPSFGNARPPPGAAPRAPAPAQQTLMYQQPIEDDKVLSSLLWGDSRNVTLPPNGKRGRMKEDLSLLSRGKEDDLVIGMAAGIQDMSLVCLSRIVYIYMHVTTTI